MDNKLRVQVLVKQLATYLGETPNKEEQLAQEIELKYPHLHLFTVKDVDQKLSI